MRTELARMREMLRAALPEKAFLRRDRGDGLFISNAPAFDRELAAIPGFILEEAGSLIRILPDAAWIQRLEEKIEPADHLCESLVRFRGVPSDEANIRLFSMGLKLLDMGASVPDNEILAFDRALRQRAALALRGGCGGALYAAAIVNYEIHKGE